MTIELAENTDGHQKALEDAARSPVKPCGACNGRCTGKCKQQNEAPQKPRKRLSWDERQYYKLRQVFIMMGKAGILRTLGMLFVRHGLLRPLAVSFKSWLFVKTITSGWCSRKIYTERMGTCFGCPLMQTVNGKQYCGGCGCPKWILSRLSVKNWFKRNHCPKGLHKE